MSEAKHTPGPWLIGSDQRLVYALHHNGDFHKGAPLLVNRFSAYVEPYTSQGGTIEEAQANARLIAAAPELLAHAEADIADLEYYIGNPSAWDSFDNEMSERLRRVYDRARAAIAKATAHSTD